MRDLVDFIWRTHGDPFVWGVSDCLIWPGDAVRALTDFDPVARYRGQYSTAREAMCYIRNGGGVEALMGENLDGTLPRNNAAKTGVGVVRIGRRDYGCVMSSGVPYVRGDRCLVAVPFAPFAAWGV